MSDIGPEMSLLFDKRGNDMQGVSAMTTAQTRIPASPIGLAGVSAFIIFVVVLILPL